MVFGVGINDMPRGWPSKKNVWNYKVYVIWHNMIGRCYDENIQKKCPTYKDCIVCEKWLTLSNFVEDIPKIDGYDEDLFLSGILVLDKDIKSNGVIKEYYLENCMFITKSENSKQARKTTNYDYQRGEKNPMYGKHHSDEIKEKMIKNQPNRKKVIQYDKDGNLIKIYDGIREAQRLTGITCQNILNCCRGRQKTAGGYIWRYYKE